MSNNTFVGLAEALFNDELSLLDRAKHQILDEIKTNPDVLIVDDQLAKLQTQLRKVDALKQKAKKHLKDILDMKVIHAMLDATEPVDIERMLELIEKRDSISEEKWKTLIEESLSEKTKASA